METKEYFEKEMFFRKPTFNSLYDPFGSPCRGQKPSLPLRKAPPFSPSLSSIVFTPPSVPPVLGDRNPQGREDVTALQCCICPTCPSPAGGSLTHSQGGCVISLWRTLFVFSPFSRYGTEKIVFIYNKAQTFTSSGFAFPQKICIFAENFFKYGKDTNKI